MFLFLFLFFLFLLYVCVSGPRRDAIGLIPFLFGRITFIVFFLSFFSFFSSRLDCKERAYYNNSSLFVQVIEVQLQVRFFPFPLPFSPASCQPEKLGGKPTDSSSLFLFLSFLRPGPGSRNFSFLSLFLLPFFLFFSSRTIHGKKGYNKIYFFFSLPSLF